MADTTFQANVTTIDAPWLNDVNDTVYSGTGPGFTVNSGTNSRTLNERFSEIVNVRDFGMLGNGTDELAQLNDAIARLNSLGRGVLYFPAPDSGTYVINGQPTFITVPCAVIGQGRGVVTLDQQSWGLPCFELRGAHGSTVSGFTLTTSATRTVLNGSYDGEPERAHAAGVYVANSNDVTVKRCNVTRQNTGVMFRGITANTTDQVWGQNVDDLYVNDVEQGVLAQQLNSSHWHNVRGDAFDNTQNVGPHLLYHSGGNSTTRSKRLIITASQCHNNIYASGFKVREVDDVIIGDISVTSSARGVDFEDCDDLAMSGFLILNLIQYAPDTQQSGFTHLNCKRHQISAGEITIADGVADIQGIAIRENSDDLTYEDISMRCSYPTGNLQYLIRLNLSAGTGRATFRNFEFRNLGTDSAREMIRVDAGDVRIDKAKIVADSNPDQRLLFVTGGTCHVDQRWNDFKGLTRTDIIRPPSGGTLTVGWSSPYPLTVSTLPPVDMQTRGSRFFVTDATATTFNSVVAGGGSNQVPVFSDGTDWRIG